MKINKKNRKWNFWILFLLTIIFLLFIFVIIFRKSISFSSKEKCEEFYFKKFTFEEEFFQKNKNNEEYFKKLIEQIKNEINLAEDIYILKENMKKYHYIFFNDEELEGVPLEIITKNSSKYIKNFSKKIIINDINGIELYIKISQNDKLNDIYKEIKKKKEELNEEKSIIVSSNNFKYIDVKSDGNCYFYAWSVFLNGYRYNKIFNLRLRMAIVLEIIKNWDYYLENYEFSIEVTDKKTILFSIKRNQSNILSIEERQLINESKIDIDLIKNFINKEKILIDKKYAIGNKMILFTTNILKRPLFLLYPSYKNDQFECIINYPLDYFSNKNKYENRIPWHIRFINNNHFQAIIIDIKKVNIEIEKKL